MKHLALLLVICYHTARAQVQDAQAHPQDEKDREGRILKNNFNYASTTVTVTTTVATSTYCLSSNAALTLCAGGGKRRRRGATAATISSDPISTVDTEILSLSIDTPSRSKRGLIEPEGVVSPGEETITKTGDPINSRAGRFILFISNSFTSTVTTTSTATSFSTTFSFSIACTPVNWTSYNIANTVCG